MQPEELIVEGAELPAKKFRGYFLGKRVPQSLMIRAMGLPGKAFAVYMMIWIRFSIEKEREVELERKFFEGSGLAPTSITRGINALVGAWLIEERSRKPGATPKLYLRTEDEVKLCEEALAEY